MRLIAGDLDMTPQNDGRTERFSRACRKKATIEKPRNSFL